MRSHSTQPLGEWLETLLLDLQRSGAARLDGRVLIDQ
jgi:hypothetical protein